MRFVYNQSVPLYASEMLVFVDDVFAGFSEMPTMLPKAEVLLPMGDFMRGNQRPSVCLYARDKNGTPVGSTAAVATSVTSTANA